MTAPDSFATPEQAAGYGYALPDATALGLLARATQAIRNAAGIPVTQATSTLRVQARYGEISLPSPAVTAVSAVTLVNDDGTTSSQADWHWIAGPVIWLGREIAGDARRHGWFDVTFTHGFATIPAGLVMLTGAVATRLQFTPVAAQAGIKSQTVGSVSQTFGDTPGDDLTEYEVRQLSRIVPVRRVFQVGL